MKLPPLDAQGKVAVVTGGGRGLGRDFALALATAGCDLILAGRTLSSLEETANEIAALGQRVLAVPTDVTEPTSVRRMVDKAVQEYGRIDVLVNNAGYGVRQMAEEVTKEEWDRTVTVNLTGVFICGQAVGRQMIAQRQGKIINVVSPLARRTWPGSTAYGATKAAIVHLTRLWAQEWARFGVTVNAIGPGYVNTGMTAAVLENEKYVARLMTHIPFRRLGTVEEILAPLVFLASEGSDYITGQTLYVDGGWTIAE